MVSEILQVMFWLRGEGFATSVTAATIRRFAGRSEEELEEWFDLMVRQGLVERDGNEYCLTEAGVRDASRPFQKEFDTDRSAR